MKNKYRFLLLLLYVSLVFTLLVVVQTMVKMNRPTVHLLLMLLLFLPNSILEKFLNLR